jgi:hypothetical protein
MLDRAMIGEAADWAREIGMATGFYLYPLLPDARERNAGHSMSLQPSRAGAFSLETSWPGYFDGPAPEAPEGTTSVGAR